jgi:hypothetical protein
MTRLKLIKKCHFLNKLLGVAVAADVYSWHVASFPAFDALFAEPFELQGVD